MYCLVLYFYFQDRSRPYDTFNLHSLENSLMDMIRTDHEPLKGKHYPPSGPPMSFADIMWRNHFAGQEYSYVHSLLGVLNKNQLFNNCDFICCLFLFAFVCFCKALWNVFKIDFFFFNLGSATYENHFDCFNHNVWQKHVLDT